MKPAFDQLADEYKTSESVIIADVDCTKDENKALCSKMGVRGYPTVKYFTGSTSGEGEKYEGGRDFKALSEFAKTSLGPSCGNDKRELCDEDQVKFLDEKVALGASAIKAEIEELEAANKKAEDDLQATLKSLQTQYEEAKETKETTQGENAPKLRLLRSIKSDAKDEL